jgi:hypothetical protein
MLCIYCKSLSLKCRRLKSRSKYFSQIRIEQNTAGAFFVSAGSGHERVCFSMSVCMGVCEGVCVWVCSRVYVSQK